MSEIQTYAVLDDDGVVDNVVICEDPNFFVIGYPGRVVILVEDKTGPAIVGEKYDAKVGKFMPAKTWPSWVFNPKKWVYEAPKAYPTDGKPYLWDESVLDWVEPVPPTEA